MPTPQEIQQERRENARRAVRAYSPTALDAQLGVCAILKRMQQRGIALVFAG